MSYRCVNPYQTLKSCASFYGKLAYINSLFLLETRYLYRSPFQKGRKKYSRVEKSFQYGTKNKYEYAPL